MGSPVSPIVCNLYMEHLESKAIDTAPLELKPRIWKRYVDDIFEVVKRGTTLQLTEHLNSVDATGSIKFTYEEQVDNSLPFLDVKLSKLDSGRLKVQIYRKKTHTDQYLHFDSCHPPHQK